MNFHRPLTREQPEINLIPLIDVLLVILIFLLLSTSFSQINILRIQLPNLSQMQQEKTDKPTVHVSLSATGKVEINQYQLEKADVNEISQIFVRLAGTQAADTLLVVHADAQATHQSVIHIMEAARIAGLARVSFATQNISR